MDDRFAAKSETIIIDGNTVYISLEYLYYNII